MDPNKIADTLNEIGTAFEEFKTVHNGKITTLERKLNAEIAARDQIDRELKSLRFAGHGNDQSDVSNRDALIRDIKAWYPARAATADEVDEKIYAKAFSKYLRHGVHQLDAEERKAMTIGSDAEGGFLVPPGFFTLTILKVEQKNSVMRQVARQLQIGTTDIEIPAVTGLGSAAWVGETQSRPDTNTADVGRIIIPTKEIYTQPKATQGLLDDAYFNMEVFLADQIGESFAIAEDAAFISGDGTLQPRGFLTYPISTVDDAAGTRPWGTLQNLTTGVNGDFPATAAGTIDLLMNIVHSLKPGYRTNAVWLMPTAVLNKIRQIKQATTSQPIFAPSLQASLPSTLLGYPIYEAEQMPALATGSLSLAFGDFKRGYWITDRFGIRTLRDPFTDKPYVKFYATKRVGGGLVDSLAIKLLKFS